MEKVGNAPFIDKKPVEIVSSGDVQDVPWITSVASEEGLYPVAGKIFRKIEDNEKILLHIYIYIKKIVLICYYRVR